MATKKPKGRKYRNLVLRGDVVYYERVVKGERIRVSTRTSDWAEAAAVRDEYEERKGIGQGNIPLRHVPRFAEFAERYLTEDTGYLAPTTLEERRRELAPEGTITPHFRALRLDEIDARTIRAWWMREIEQKGRQVKTGRNYLDALSAVLDYARELDLW